VYTRKRILTSVGHLTKSLVRLCFVTRTTAISRQLSSNYRFRLLRPDPRCQKFIVEIFHF